MNRNLHQSRSEQGAIRAAAYASADVVLDGAADEPALGAHLITQRRGYEHHGIYVGGGKVIHYAGFAKSAHRGPVEEVALEAFADGHAVAVRPHPFPMFSAEQTVLRARSRLGENQYRLLTNNCEHFCAWCLLGESRSEQVHACFTHPRAGVHALLCLVSAFIENRMKTGRAVVNAA
ncbi:lecithin retinol acyltransferase family protein [Paraburkholderia sp. C35]|uniref:lecithin retinol acyltransferase family protein n=1 Tax=Paraburkholderia sp. C35 TaxID=2126993 RepID=UPI000D693F1D|nr:lecithin retinol acyltransferase family protein [Paraburkholderia sp. C35]